MAEPSFYPAQHTSTASAASCGQRGPCSGVWMLCPLKGEDLEKVQLMLRSGDFHQEGRCFTRYQKHPPDSSGITWHSCDYPGTLIVSLSFRLPWDYRFIQRLGWWLEWKEYLGFWQKYQMLGNGSINNTILCSRNIFWLYFMNWNYG